MVFFWLLLACCSRVSLMLLQSLHAHYNPTCVYAKLLTGAFQLPAGLWVGTNCPLFATSRFIDDVHLNCVG